MKAASFALVANSIPSAPSMSSELRKNIEKPKPITWRNCSLSFVSREEISPVRDASKNAGDKVSTCANTA